MKKIKWAIISIIGIMISYVFFIEPGRIEVNYINKTDKPGARIAFFSDLHLWRLKGFHDRIIEELKALEPELILFGGDAYSDFTKPTELGEFFKKLTEIAPVYSIYGNWEEAKTIETRAIYEEAGVEILHNRSVIVEVNGRKIGITGTPSQYYMRRTKLLEDDELDANVLLIHSPIGLENYADTTRKFDYVLAGHTHGGQFDIPYITSWILNKTGHCNCPYFKGEYESGDTTIYVTRGIGQWFPGRLNSVPEIVVLDIP